MTNKVETNDIALLITKAEIKSFSVERITHNREDEAPYDFSATISLQAGEHNVTTMGIGNRYRQKTDITYVEVDVEMERLFDKIFSKIQEGANISIAKYNPKLEDITIGEEEEKDGKK